jgi:hypothetical protein
MLQIVLEDSLRCVKCAAMNAFFLGSDTLKKGSGLAHNRLAMAIACQVRNLQANQEKRFLSS